MRVDTSSGPQPTPEHGAAASNAILPYALRTVAFRSLSFTIFSLSVRVAA